jgi:hypothetical protein
MWQRRALLRNSRSNGAGIKEHTRIMMSTYRTARPLVVDAFQCIEDKTIATDLGFINVKRGDWVICGEGGESYIVDDAFFRRTFAAVDDVRAACRALSPRSSRPSRTISISHMRQR